MRVADTSSGKYVFIISFSFVSVVCHHTMIGLSLMALSFFLFPSFLSLTSRDALWSKFFGTPVPCAPPSSCSHPRTSEPRDPNNDARSHPRLCDALPLEGLGGELERYEAESQ